ncbi:unnamed protein product [Prorocentrum cordatum]|uniref:Uncharacterized protein n=1 Tax=Prorocentrum cordatum TaxID=2364126 RepID=A0ABN9R106_9DINO|nr:unnamed protein product [Polarella glacialis]
MVVTGPPDWSPPSPLFTTASPRASTITSTHDDAGDLQVHLLGPGLRAPARPAPGRARLLRLGAPGSAARGRVALRRSGPWRWPTGAPRSPSATRQPRRARSCSVPPRPLREPRTPGSLLPGVTLACSRQEYSDKELTALLQVAKGGGELVGDSLAVVERWGRYKEVQIHGEIRWDTNVSALVVNDRHRGDPLVEKIRQKLPAPVRWMEDMKSRVVNRADRLQTRDSSVKLNSLYEDSQSSTTSI